MAGVTRVKTTIPPPHLCDGCYHETRAGMLEKYLKKLRKNLIVIVKDRRTLRIKLKQLQAAKVVREAAETEREREPTERDHDLVDLVDQFNKHRGE